MAASHTSIHRIVQLGFFTAIALTIFLVELQIPSPVPLLPGMKLGLANLVTLFLLQCRPWKEALLVLLARILIGSIFGGQLVTLVYALTGGMLSFFAMLLMTKLLHGKQLWFVSIVGGLLHNIGQLLAANAFMGTAVWSYLPFLMLFGIGTGLFNGLVAACFLKALRRTPYADRFFQKSKKN